MPASASPGAMGRTASGLRAMNRQDRTWAGGLSSAASTCSTLLLPPLATALAALLMRLWGTRHAWMVPFFNCTTGTRVKLTHARDSASDMGDWLAADRQTLIRRVAAWVVGGKSAGPCGRYFCCVIVPSRDHGRSSAYGMANPQSPPGNTHDLTLLPWLCTVQHSFGPFECTVGCGKVSRTDTAPGWFSTR